MNLVGLGPPLGKNDIEVVLQLLHLARIVSRRGVIEAADAPEHRDGFRLLHDPDAIRRVRGPHVTVAGDHWTLIFFAFDESGLGRWSITGTGNRIDDASHTIVSYYVFRM